ncbi:NAD-dependent epimerase/dehydratase family protein [Serinibacter salmoneus]|uniref:Nucleoside-diphosphate-sugar epimerase n=1 Tax=Serinibacter salmoneus TaxID=556530 RepID=A0A2A9CX42_9MICO|nr:NAD-dependent epimerase/dehydratase family protein [Serinibacter salmoneus]PFG18575.1 nucleoside-diphosphate-sugar epimerase [Serinibacter salmoneus]
MTTTTPRVLVLGGTGWLGGEIARAALAAGAAVTCASRGSAPAPSGARHVRVDRDAPDAFREQAVAEALAGEWDEVVDVSSTPAHVSAAVTALGPRARHWTYVSTVSVYAANAQAGADESADLVEPSDHSDYSHAKVAAERACQEGLGDRLLIARPGLIVGPGDRGDRFGYWPARMARAAGRDGARRVLTPTIAGRAAQAIDVADLAAWITSAGAGGLTGAINAVGPETTYGHVLELAAAAAGANPEYVEVEDAWLLARSVNYWAGPRSLPLWLPEEFSAMMRRSDAAFRAAGGRTRPLAETIERVLADERARGLDRERRSGLTAVEEASLLAQV